MRYKKDTKNENKANSLTLFRSNLLSHFPLIPSSNLYFPVSFFHSFPPFSTIPSHALSPPFPPFSSVVPITLFLPNFHFSSLFSSLSLPPFYYLSPSSLSLPHSPSFSSVFSSPTFHPSSPFPSSFSIVLITLFLPNLCLLLPSPS